MIAAAVMMVGIRRGLRSIRETILSLFQLANLVIQVLIMAQHIQPDCLFVIIASTTMTIFELVFNEIAVLPQVLIALLNPLQLNL